MVAAILQASGLRVGLYTSPHLVDFRERIRVNGAMIPEAAVADFTDRLRAATPPDLVPTFFETTTAMAFLHFAEAHVDLAVLEVGLGGRFDATNVVTPVACAITTIALDHQEYLGRTAAAIAFEKAGIIKPSVPVVIGRIGDEAASVIKGIAQERTAPLRQLGQDFFVDGENPDCFAYRSGSREFDGLSCALAGRHQMDNAACALALLDAATPAGVTVDEAAVRQGLRSVRWEGRLEPIERDPLLLLDGAHNPAAAEVVARYLDAFRQRHPESRVILVLGMMRDKDHRGFVAPLRQVVSEVILTEASLARSATVHELRPSFADWWQPIHEASSPTDALLLAKTRASRQDLICVTGSLMLLGDIKATLRGCGLSPLRG
jgi:dihydrofolate synthase/folylpolyglutamate synthase